MSNVVKLYPDLSPREQARAARLKFDHGYGDTHEAMRWLAWSFHVLHDAEGLHPEWDPNKLWRWAKRRSKAARCAALFVLNVWNAEPGGKRRPWPKFDFQEAISCWDGRNHEAFLGWVENPWWP